MILQAALTVWVIALTLRAHGFGRIPLLLAGTIAVLSLISTLPWLTSIFLTDIFAGLGVLALYLLLLRPGSLSRGERFALIALIAICAATHSATIAVLLALGAILVLAANFMVAKRLSWAPGGFAGRSAACCRTASFKNISMITPLIRSLGCVPTYKDQLPDDAEVWF